MSTVSNWGPSFDRGGVFFGSRVGFLMPPIDSAAIISRQHFLARVAWWSRKAASGRDKGANDQTPGMN